MSTESVSELPIHYSEVQKDGTGIERLSEERSRQRSLQDAPAPLVMTIPQFATIHRASLWRA